MIFYIDICDFYSGYIYLLPKEAMEDEDYIYLWLEEQMFIDCCLGLCLYIKVVDVGSSSISVTSLALISLLGFQFQQRFPSC